MYTNPYVQSSHQISTYLIYPHCLFVTRENGSPDAFHLWYLSGGVSFPTPSYQGNPSVVERASQLHPIRGIPQWWNELPNSILSGESLSGGMSFPTPSYQGNPSVVE